MARLMLSLLSLYLYKTLPTLFCSDTMFVRALKRASEKRHDNGGKTMLEALSLDHVHMVGPHGVVDKAVSLDDRPLVSLVVPAYNEEAIIEKNLGILCRYMNSLEKQYRWELIVIDDGSTDATGELADGFAKARENVQVLHHMFNSRIGQAFRTAFKCCKGDYVVTLDLDLSYSTDHIQRMLDKIRETRAMIVIASPYMPGGKVSNVPFQRKFLSRWANRFLSFFVRTPNGRLKTLTGMVRAYDRKFLSRLVLKAMDIDIHCEIVYKAAILRARMVEIPAHLNWHFAKDKDLNRSSKMRIARAIVMNLLAGFILRPFMFFFMPGWIVSFFAFYAIFWAFYHTIKNYLVLIAPPSNLTFPVSESIAAALSQSPQSFIIGGLGLMVAIQLISLGFLSLQNKRYFEELFHMGTKIYSEDRHLPECNEQNLRPLLHYQNQR
jgi:glycosyltransferase involved in cell wall biosynthesis